MHIAVTVTFARVYGKSKRVHNAAKNNFVHKTCPFKYCILQKIRIKYILYLSVDTSTNYAQIISATDYQHGWSKCLNSRYVSEARFKKKKQKNRQFI